jgi:hypothetical protein
MGQCHQERRDTNFTSNGAHTPTKPKANARMKAKKKKDESDTDSEYENESDASESGASVVFVDSSDDDGWSLSDLSKEEKQALEKHVQGEHQALQKQRVANSKDRVLKVRCSILIMILMFHPACDMHSLRYD